MARKKKSPKGETGASDTNDLLGDDGSSPASTVVLWRVQTDRTVRESEQAGKKRDPH